jgi:hypothetical protein
MQVEIGFHDLTEAGKLKIAKSYGYQSIKEFKENENYEFIFFPLIPLTDFLPNEKEERH